MIHDLALPQLTYRTCGVDVPTTVVSQPAPAVTVAWVPADLVGTARGDAKSSTTCGCENHYHDGHTCTLDVFPMYTLMVVNLMVVNSMTLYHTCVSLRVVNLMTLYQASTWWLWIWWPCTTHIMFTLYVYFNIMTLYQAFTWWLWIWGPLYLMCIGTTKSKKQLERLSCVYNHSFLCCTCMEHIVFVKKNIPWTGGGSVIEFAMN